MNSGMKNASTQVFSENESKSFGVQCEIAPKVEIKEVEKIVVQTVEKIREVEKIIEKPIIETRYIEKIVEKPVVIQQENV